MNIEDIKKNAPKGATHYRLINNRNVKYYIKTYTGMNLAYVNGEWMYSTWCSYNPLIKPLN